MTSASELFYNRRSRIIRSLDIGEDLSLQRTINGGPHRRHGNARMDRLDLNGSTLEPFRRISHSSRVSSHRPSLLQERESVVIDEGSSSSSSQSASGIITNSVNIGRNQDRTRHTGNNRLPGAVLLARERLVQRLRSVSVSGNRETNRPLSGVNHNQGRLSDDLMFLEASILENEISREWSTRSSVVEMQTKKRSEGLSIEALCKLQSEVFTMSAEISAEDEKWTAFRECSICLESFIEGEELTRLPCGHRFHTGCLYPWITTCGDCPNCRAGVVKSFSED